jgi:hypothetical protein
LSEEARLLEEEKARAYEVRTGGGGLKALVLPLGVSRAVWRWLVVQAYCELKARHQVIDGADMVGGWVGGPAAQGS